MIKKKYTLFCLSIGVFLLVITDQLLKYKIRHLSGFYICNQGISFGFSITTLIFWFIFSVFLSLILFYFYYLKNEGLLTPLFLLSFLLIFGGAFSNAIDRLLAGCVIDFININFLSFPVFNLADIFIFIGISLLSLLLFKK